MAGTGQNQQQQQQQQEKTLDHRQNLKYSYFHYNNTSSPGLLNKIPSSPSVCTSTDHQQTMVSPLTSPWYTIASENEGLSIYDGNSPTLTLMQQQQTSSPILPLNLDSTNTISQPYENYGHFFVKKTFHKPTYCHHCVEMLWGLIGQGYYCEVCNFICHDRCRKHVISPCSSIAPILIKVTAKRERAREKKRR